MGEWIDLDIICLRRVLLLLIVSLFVFTISCQMCITHRLPYKRILAAAILTVRSDLQWYHFFAHTVPNNEIRITYPPPALQSQHPEV